MVKDHIDMFCKGTEVGDAGFSLCGGLVKTTKSLSAFLSWFIPSLLVDGYPSALSSLLPSSVCLLLVQ